MIRLSIYLFLLAFMMPMAGLSQDQDQDKHQPSTINIGLLVPDSTHTQFIWAAEAAVAKANRIGGYRNQDFKLVIRSAEGLWGTGSKESVALVYEDEVCAMVGSLDGRNAHLAEQVAAKTHLSYIEAYATDPTLSQAFVPWFMRVVPNDDQQAEAIVEIILKNGGGKIGILSNNTYDARYAVKSLDKAAEQRADRAPLIIHVESLDQQIPKILARIQEGELDHLILPFDAESNKDLLVSLKKAMPSLKLYGTLHFTMGAESRKIPWKLYEGMYLISAGPIWISNTQITGSDYLFPPARDASTQDAVELIIQSIKTSGHRPGKHSETFVGNTI